jgi:hypothetical protein
MSKAIDAVFFDTHDAGWIFFVGAFWKYITWLHLIKTSPPGGKECGPE